VSITVIDVVDGVLWLGWRRRFNPGQLCSFVVVVVVVEFGFVVVVVVRGTQLLVVLRVARVGHGRRFDRVFVVIQRQLLVNQSIQSNRSIKQSQGSIRAVSTQPGHPFVCGPSEYQRKPTRINRCTAQLISPVSVVWYRPIQCKLVLIVENPTKSLSTKPPLGSSQRCKSAGELDAFSQFPSVWNT